MFFETKIEDIESVLAFLIPAHPAAARRVLRLVPPPLRRVELDPDRRRFGVGRAAEVVQHDRGSGKQEAVEPGQAVPVHHLLLSVSQGARGVGVVYPIDAASEAAAPPAG